MGFWIAVMRERISSDLRLELEEESRQEEVERLQEIKGGTSNLHVFLRGSTARPRPALPLPATVHPAESHPSRFRRFRPQKLQEGRSDTQRRQQQRALRHSRHQLRAKQRQDGSRRKRINRQAALPRGPRPLRKIGDGKSG